MKQIKIYDVKTRSVENARILLSADEQYFYWNNSQFLNDGLEDIVFIINRYDRWAILSKINKTDIITNNVDDRSSFEDNGQLFHLDDPDHRFQNFIRFKVIEKKKIPEGWNWSRQLGQSETIYLVKEGIQGETERISKIEDLRKIFSEGEAVKFLDSAHNFLENKKSNFDHQNKSKSNSKNKEIKTDRNMGSILTAIQTKPFILLAGLSGTGKSRLARTLAYQTCPNDDNLRKDPKKPGNFELIPVRPNWHDSSELMGYVSRINGEKYITTPFLKFIAKAWLYPEIPFFLCMDEMNLAPVEQYFAEYLSIIETRQNQNSKIVTDYLISKADFENKGLYNQILEALNLHEKIEFREGIGIPHNLVVIGTVNMDETTHSFSRKVLDRAMTFEMNEIDLNAGLKEDQIDWQYPSECIPNKKIIGQFTSGAQIFKKNQELSNKTIDFLKKINEALEKTPFKIAYRVRDEFLIYCFHASINQANDENENSWFNQALDEMTTMKILSRIEGDEGRTGNALRELEKILRPDFKKSGAKLEEMITRLENSGYTSFWA